MDNSLRSLSAGQNAQAFANLYYCYYKAVFAEICRFVKDKETAEDLLQDTFVVIWQKGHQYDSAKGAVYTWIITIARNKCIDHLRKPNALLVPFVDGSNSEETFYRQPTSSLDFSLLYKRFKTMSAVHLELIRLIYVYGYTHIEASKKCNIPEGTVKTFIRKFVKDHGFAS